MCFALNIDVVVLVVLATGSLFCVTFDPCHSGVFGVRFLVLRMQITDIWGSET